MSAFVVDKEHLDAMVAAAVDGPRDHGPSYPGDAWHGPFWEHGAAGSNDWRNARREDADTIGEMLMLECVRSVSYRYDDSDTLPGPIDAYWTRTYAFNRRIHKPNAVECLKLISSYEYQSCEHPEWHGSEAERFCNALRKSLDRALPGYEDARWTPDGSERDW